MTLTFLPRQESFSIEFEPEAHHTGHHTRFEPETHHTGFDPENNVLDSMGAETHQQGSRKEIGRAHV